MSNTPSFRKKLAFVVERMGRRGLERYMGMGQGTTIRRWLAGRTRSIPTARRKEIESLYRQMAKGQSRFEHLHDQALARWREVLGEDETTEEEPSHLEDYTEAGRMLAGVDLFPYKPAYLSRKAWLAGTWRSFRHSRRVVISPNSWRVFVMIGVFIDSPGAEPIGRLDYRIAHQPFLNPANSADREEDIRDAAVGQFNYFARAGEQDRVSIVPLLGIVIV